MPENHKGTILLLEQKLEETRREENLCNRKMVSLSRSMESTESIREEIWGKIKSLEASILDMKSLDKPKPAAKKPKPKKEA